MQENKPVLGLENTDEIVYQKLVWKKNICQCALMYIVQPRALFLPLFRQNKAFPLYV